MAATRKPAQPKPKAPESYTPKEAIKVATERARKWAVRPAAREVPVSPVEDGD